jgi:hypothetical protein
MSTAFKNVGIIAVYVMCICVFSEQTFGNEIDEFREQYHSDFEKIQNKLKCVRGKMKLTTERKDDKGKKLATFTDDGDFAISGKYGKCVLNIKRSSTFGKLEAIYVYCKQNEAAFKLSKRKGEDRFSIDNYDSPQMPVNNNGPSPMRFVDYQLNCGQLWTAPYLFYSNDWRSVLDTNHQPPVKIEKINENGKKTTRISYDAKGDDNLRIEIDMEDDFHHRILRSGFISKKSGKPVFQYHVEYVEDSFIPKTVTYYSKQEQIKCEFSDLVFKPIPLEEFQPGFFGIPDIGRSKSKNRFNYYLRLSRQA